MTYVVTRRPLKLTNDKTFEVGEFITDEDFKVIPERILISRKRSLIEQGLIEHTDEKWGFSLPTQGYGPEATLTTAGIVDARTPEETWVTSTTDQQNGSTATTADVSITETTEMPHIKYLPIGRWQLPNGDIFKGKKKEAHKYWKELKAGE